MSGGRARTIGLPHAYCHSCTRLVLAEAVVAVAETGHIPEDARTLLAEARARFAACGAAGDLARAEQVAATWQTR